MDSSYKCKERQAWPMLNLSSASMLSPKASRARQNSSGAMSKLQSEQSKLEIYISYIIVERHDDDLLLSITYKK